MNKVELPAGNGKDLARLLEDARISLPIAGCATSKNDLLSNYESFGETEYEAPDGKGFRISGEFTVWVESDDVATTFSHFPDSSIALFERQERDRIDNERLSRGISYQEALDERVEDARDDMGYLQTLPHEFIGKKLAIRVESGKPVVCVKGPVYADAEGAFAMIDLPAPGGVDATESYVAEVPLRLWHWERPIASAPADICRVQLVDYEDPKPVLYIAKPDPRETTFWTPDDTLSSRVLGAGRAALNRRGFIVTSKMPEELPSEVSIRQQEPEDLPF